VLTADVLNTCTLNNATLNNATLNQPTLVPKVQITGPDNIEFLDMNVPAGYTSGIYQGFSSAGVLKGLLGMGSITGVSGVGVNDIALSSVSGQVYLQGSGGVTSDSYFTVKAGGSSGSMEVTAAAGTQIGIFYAQSGQTTWLLRQPASDSTFRIYSSVQGDVITCGSAGGVTIGGPSAAPHLLLAEGGALPLLQIAAAGGVGAAIRLLGSSAAQGVNWLIGNQYNVSATLEFTPSTTAGGTSTFTTPLMQLNGSSRTVTIGSPASGNTALQINANVGVGVRASMTDASPALLAVGNAATQLVALEMTQSGQTTWLQYQQASDNNFRLWNGSTGDTIICANTGAVTIPAPASGAIALTVSATGTNPAVQVNSGGYFYSAGTTQQFMLSNTSGALWASLATDSASAMAIGVSTALGTGLGNFTGLLQASYVSSVPLLKGRGPVAAGYVDMTPDTGTFTLSYVGGTAAASGTANWYRIGKIVTLLLPGINAMASNSTSFSATGLPAAITPPTAPVFVDLSDQIVEDNSAFVNNAVVRVLTTGTLVFYKSGQNAASWTASGNKYFTASTPITYPLF
jgi:hypothetical protein